VLGRFISPDPIVPDPGNPQSLNRYSYVGNNPVNLTDPSGHSWLSKFFHRAMEPVLRVVVPIVTVVVSIAAAVTQQYWAIPIIAAAGSAAETALNHGNAAQILESAGIGAGAAGLALGVGWAANATLASITSPALAEFGSTVAAAGVGGFAQGTGQARVMGASWSEAFRSGYQTAAIAGGATALTLFARATYLEIVHYEPDPMPGGAAVGKGALDYPVEGANNVGEWTRSPNSPGFFEEGGQVSRLFNRILGVNATAGFHDVMQVELERLGGEMLRNVLNVPGMPVAAAVSYPAMVSRDPNLAVDMSYLTERARSRGPRD
jgi:hypothetical protein